MPPLCPTLAVIPPDTLAPRNIAADADISWHQEYGPEWNGENCNKGAAEVEAVAPLDGSTNSASIVAARAGTSGRAVPYRNMATAATGHSGALMAILLSKLANGGYSSDSTLDTAVAPSASGDGDAGTTPPEAAAAAAALSRAEVLHRSVDSIARGLDNTLGVDAAAPVANGGGSWAWKARVDQTPHYSKLRRYDFVRELGSGSHGTILLVRKRPVANHHIPSISDGGLDVNKHSSRGSGGGSRRRSGGGSHDHGSVTSSSIRDTGGSCTRTVAGGLRVLKESPFLPEAVNEARLLLLAGGGSEGDGGAVSDGLGSRARTDDAGIGSGAGDVGVGGVVAASRRRGDGGRGYQRGEVVQVRTRVTEVTRSLFLFVAFTCLSGQGQYVIPGMLVAVQTVVFATAAATTSIYD